ncbi:MAG: hypothetical protein C0621_03075 [Desulfuromonas sp.]|nr:MAG: hypothetical protein C0621_03075 [Desulfuromonas sp.]
MIRVVAIKFRVAGRHYDFNPKELELETGMTVIVETDRGRALGIVVAPPHELEDEPPPKDLKNVVRIATPQDLNLAAGYAAREEEAYRFCLERIAERKLEMKLVRAEYLFDGSKIVFYFTADGRIDFRELVKDLAHHFHTRIEMRQIGVRDEAKLIGGLGICGRELCCCTFLTEFAPVSVKMAKEQGLALNPTKISGQCGRLLCCLAYEFETYGALKKRMPKCGRKVELDGRDAEVIEQQVIAQKVMVRFGDGKRQTVTLEQLERGVTTSPDENSEKGRESNPSESPPAQRGNGDRGRNRPQRNRRSRGGERKKEGDQEKDKDQSQNQNQNQNQKQKQKQKQKPSPKPAAPTPKPPPKDENPPPDGEKRRRPRRRRPRRKKSPQGDAT